MLRTALVPEERKSGKYGLKKEGKKKNKQTNPHLCVRILERANRIEGCTLLIDMNHNEKIDVLDTQPLNLLQVFGRISEHVCQDDLANKVCLNFQKAFNSISCQMSLKKFCQIRKKG